MKKIKFFTFIMFNIVIHAQCLNSFKIHSHNDYQHKVPLYNALENCVKSIEVDVHLKNDTLFVAHNDEDIDNSKTIENMYLQPLAEILENEDSRYYFNYELFLLVDFKTEANKTYKKLFDILQNYRKYLTFVDENNKLKTKNIRVIISGNRPNKNLLNKNKNFCFLDGRSTDIGENKSSILYPLISEDWGLLVKNAGNPNDLQKLEKKLKSYVQNIHKENKMARIWGIPDNEKYWQFQKDIGIDLINTDKVSELKEFLQK